MDPKAAGQLVSRPVRERTAQYGGSVARRQASRIAMRSSVYRFLLSRRWVSLMLVALLAVPACVALGRWQLDRLHRAQARNHRVAANSGANPVDLTSLTTVGGQIGRDLQ